ncbi:MAG: UDP-N-acetylmuramoyl-L-alanyl-D-glutamate--2,6-diaminopimelate ligase [Candidatus Omnitrophota bacterium]|nr:UDP-N-acetylmuramoyl-L-alanyl-D-glutamate--2,6-diaminopimelate ligase [Candidatus Omnitrophota bacterium]
MRVEELTKLIKNRKVSGISSNSKTIRKNFIFVAVKGSQIDGSKFIGEALAKGAKFIVCDSNVKIKYSGPVKFIRVKDTRFALARLAACFYNDPSEKIKVIGITGTNGKTTISYLLEAILKESEAYPGVIGTVNYRYKNKVIPAKNTTPGPVEIQSLLADMAKGGIDYAAMEVSSHALDQDRVEGVNFHSAIFTNLTQDHLDYHKTIKDYFNAKAKLFKQISPQSFVVINNDDKYSLRLKKITPAKIITYGIKNRADLRAQDIKFDINYTEFNLFLRARRIKFRIKLIGRHNIYNMLAACAWGIKEGIALKIIKRALEKFSSVPGRLERINSKKGFCVFIDYAHTDDALKNCLKALRQFSPKRIITLFGCGGERDKLKRPKMGKVVTSLSDLAVITSDNPRSEDPGDIIKDIEKGIKRSNYRVILERGKAIQKTLLLARAGDIVLLAGKGHEHYQVLKDKTIHFDDKEEARLCLQSLNY